MRTNKKNLFASGVLILFFLVIISPMFCNAAAYSVRWDMELGENSLRNLSVDIDDNLYYSFRDYDEGTTYFSKVSKEGWELYNKTLNSEPNFYSYRIDDYGNHFFVFIDEIIIPEHAVLGREFTILKYTNDLILNSTIKVNLSSYFEGEFLGNLYYVDSDCIYFAIWEYQTEYTDLDSIQLAKFSTAGERLWNRTIAYNPKRTIFGFCKNSYGNIYVENEDVLFYIDDENGEEIWQKVNLMDDPYLMAFKEHVLMVDFTPDGRLVLKLCDVSESIAWELFIQKENVNGYFLIQNAAINDEYLGISVVEVYYDSDKQEKTNIFYLKMLSITKEILYEEEITMKIDEADNIVVDNDRCIKILPTSEGHFYLNEFVRDRANDIVENTIKYCIPKTNFIPGYTFIITLSSISIFVLAIIIRRRTSK